MKEMPIYNQLLSIRLSWIVDILVDLVDPDFTLLEMPYLFRNFSQFFLRSSLLCLCMTF